MKVNSLFKSMFFLLVALVSIGVAQAQEKMITGSVVDKSTREFLPGVTIAVEGTARGTITDFDGNFTLKVNQGETLSISYIGYATQKVVVGSQTNIAIELVTDTQGLDEVLIIGYGSVKKEDATGAVEAVSSKEFNAGAISSPQDLLVGKASGVQITSTGGAPGAGSTIRIRGGSSMAASNDPLIVIDGVPMDTEGVSGMQNPLNSINPADIKTFTILKDASSTAIYGSRASNGVILITTKTGKKSQDIKVTYNGNVSVGTPSYKVDVMDGPSYSEFIKNTYGADSKAYLNTQTYPNQNTNWQDEIYRTSVSTDHNVSLSGGVKNLPYRLSLGYTDQKGIVKTSSMQRETVGLNLNPSFFEDQLKVSVSAKYMHIDNRFANDGAVGNAITYDPTKPVYDPNSKYGGYTTTIDTKGNPVTIAPNNPVALLDQTNNTSKVDRGIINGKFDYTPRFFSDLTATLSLGLDVSKSKGTDITDITAAWSSPNDPNRAGSYKPYTQNKNNQTLDFYLTYNKSLEDHTFKAMGGYSYQKFKRDGTDITYNAMQNNIVTPENIDKNLNYLISFFGRVEYAFKHKYLLNATFRSDATSKLKESNRWGYFPSVGFAWKIKEEAFLKDVDPISSMKLRLGWGQTGQQGVKGDTPYLGTYTVSNATTQYPWGGSYINTQRPNGYDEDLKWERTTTYNVGLDFGFFEEKLSGSFEWYYRETTDLLSEVPVPAGANLTNLLLTNVGNLTNQGVEFNLSYNAITTQDWNWRVGTNFTYNQNEITKLTNNDDPSFLGNATGGISGGTGSTIQMNSVGHPTNSFFVYEQVYDEDGRPLEGVYVDQNGDHLINDNDKIHKGQAAPKWMVGLNTSLQYKNWDFSMSGRFQFGASVYNNNASANGVKQDTYNSGGNFLSNRLPIAANSFDKVQYWSSHYVENADFFKLDNVSLGYTFNNISRAISSIRINATAQNLFIISNYTGVDPEVTTINLDGTTNVGIDNNFYPRSRTYMLGVNISF
ncbi:TonB-dependent receptor [Halosquirtibacter xylanolyticus]|uniref:SusC/RagA family TonB-linked outer membrane protein n=1 Tax=Halosquirtibacter xylanolyticus TaxID=3374599 RepID=UPI0037483E0B|nr:TonB-dependent receptor [Prolixibacteraceae bacterium]